MRRVLAYFHVVVVVLLLFVDCVVSVPAEYVEGSNDCI